MRPIGYFVHHQGRGHAERCAALVNALTCPVTIFCARDDIFPDLRAGVEIRRIPSLFEETLPTPPALEAVRTPATLHCAPLGWPGIREAVAVLTGWMHEAEPALMISDVSAEIAQLCRIASVPCVKVLQHGDRSDPGHMSAYEGCVGLLAPFHRSLAPERWTSWMLEKTHFAPGLGIDPAMPDRSEARERLGIVPDRELIVVVSGGGGRGMAVAPLTMGARAIPDAEFVVIGRTEAEWHATGVGNLALHGWVPDPETYLAAADVVVAPPGNTLCHQILFARRPWIVVPEWRYFDEQRDKAACLEREGLAYVLPDFPGTPHGWRDAIAAARALPPAPRTLVDPLAASRAARWLDRLASDLWAPAPVALAAE